MRELIPISFTAGAYKGDGFQLVVDGVVVGFVADRECQLELATKGEALEYYVTGEPIELAKEPDAVKVAAEAIVERETGTKGVLCARCAEPVEPKEPEPAPVKAPAKG